MFIINLLRSAELAISFKYIGMLASAFGPVLSIYFWVRLKKRNRMFKIRTATLLTLRDLLREHQDKERTPIKLQLELMEMRIFGVNAYKIKVPHPIGGEKYARGYCIYSRHDMPDGWYVVTERRDSLIFDLLEEDGETMTNLAFPLRLDKKTRPGSTDILIARELPKR
jgi:hypothetical protein